MRTTYTNFVDAGQALGFKVKRKVAKQVARKCPGCGNEMRHIEGTNVWVCDSPLLEEKDLNGASVQVFRTCGERIIADEIE